MAWNFVFGLARNARLVDEIYVELAQAEEEAGRTGRPARRFKDFRYSTLDSWSCRRRVIGKAEWTGGEANPRFIVTSLSRTEAGARQLYEDIYCARGDMENRLKECQGDLFADRTSAATMRANQLKLWFASMAYVLICALRRIGLAHTQFADATSGTIRLKLFKIGALVKISVRRIRLRWLLLAPTPTNGASPQAASLEAHPSEASPQRQPNAAQTSRPTGDRRQIKSSPAPLSATDALACAQDNLALSRVKLRANVPGEKCGLDISYRPDRL